MPEAPSPQSLFRIAECPDMMADGCVTDDNGYLVFLSVWARDTAIQQFLARLTLGNDAEGLNEFNIHDGQGNASLISVGGVDRLEKRATRVFRRTLFGSIVNLWLFDRRCVKPDKANARALALLRRDDPARYDRLWTLVRDTCPLPLLDHWRDAVMELLQEKVMLTRLPKSLGPLEAHQLAIDVPMLTDALGDLIRGGMLTTSPHDMVSGQPLRRAA